MYSTAKWLANILSPLVWKFVKNSAHFAELVKDLEIPHTTTMVSYDVSALFTGLLTCEAKKVIRIA